MRTQDDIEQGVSSFYAELLRVKQLVKAVSSGERVFFLLDELFKGTNSVDRHAGAAALMRWLVRQDSPERPVLGLISTHDLELGSLEETCPGVRNAHFQEWYEDGKVRFDYQLRPGVSTTRNALWLMKLAGLPIDEVNQ
jgi:DNA mismatch repair ATPase MutS